jgi:phospholipid transport system substrate-binding protein
MKQLRKPLWEPDMKRLSAVALLTLMAIAAVPAFAEDGVASAQAQTPVAATSASGVVKNFYAQLAAVMKQGDQLGFSGRYKKLEPVVGTAFNLPLMTRFAVGLVWNDATAEEQDQITKAFTTFSVATYANRFAKYNDEQFAVTDEKPTADGKLIETTLTTKAGTVYRLNYLMRQDEAGHWRIVDVFMNGAISELATRRAEFSSVIQRDGIGALVNSLDEKTRMMGHT